MCLLCGIKSNPFIKIEAAIKIGKKAGLRDELVFSKKFHDYLS